MKKATDSVQAIIDIYKCELDTTLISRNLNLTVEERLIQLKSVEKMFEELREAGRKLRHEC